MKKLLLAGLATAAALTLAACGNNNASDTGSTNGEANNELLVSTFGLSEDIVKSDIIAPFEHEFGANVTLDTGNAADRFNMFVNNPNQNIDVMELSQNFATQGYTDGLFYPITEAEVPNLADLTDAAREVFENGGGVPYAVNSIGIIYNREAVGREITSWDDLWADDLRNAVAIPNITITGGPLFMHVAALHANSTIGEDKGAGAFEALEALRPNIFATYTGSSELANLFAGGEIKVAVISEFAVGMAQDAAPGLTYFVPESGTFANFNTVNIPKGAANKELALKFINYRLSEASQASKAQSLGEGPTNKNVTLTPEQAGNLTYGAIAERSHPVDFRMVNENLADWINQWNRIMSN